MKYERKNVQRIIKNQTILQFEFLSGENETQSCPNALKQ